MPSSDIISFRKALRQAKHLTVLTGAGVSAESGVPTFRGAGGLWREYRVEQLASPEAWNRDSGMVWEFYNYRRQVMHDKKVNPGHVAIAKIERHLRDNGRGFDLITQNIDDLHLEAGSVNVTRLHGSLWQVRCIRCGRVTDNRDVPITAAFAGSGSPDPNAAAKKFPDKELPRCNTSGCAGIVRPHVVWFGETLNYDDLQAAARAAENCDIFLVVGTSAMVYPAASFAPIAKQLGAITAEVNLDATIATSSFDYVFQGKSGEILPDLLAIT